MTRVLADPQEIAGVIFDLDGVLIHSSPYHQKAFHQVFQPLGVVDFDYERYAGWRTHAVIEDVLLRRKLPLSEELVACIAQEKSKIARRLIAEYEPVDQDSPWILPQLGARYRLALASSGSRASVAGFLAVTGTRTLFSSILSGDDVVHAKPHPEIYKRAADSMGLKPRDCLIVEDAVAGVEAAKAAGASVVGIAGTCSTETLEQAGADCVISRLGELPAVLDADSERVRTLDACSWTAIIPAAGRGSRLGFGRPKILYRVAGKPILDWMLDYLAGSCSRLIFVLSPEGQAEVTAELERRIPGRFEIVVQATPTGMGDAVALAAPHVRTPHVAVVWGDQVALRKDSVSGCMRLHEGPLQPAITCPTVVRDKPYIHFERDSDGCLRGVLQAREGDAMPERGESDTGFFCFRTDALQDLLGRLRRSDSGYGARTREFNLLPIIPLAALPDESGRSWGPVVTPRLMRIEETVGINCLEDAQVIEDFLRRSHDGQA